MARDYFAVLGLSPGMHAPADVTASFLARREGLLADLVKTPLAAECRARLDELHLAYATLCDPARQADYLRASTAGLDRVAELRLRIAASLEGGLLRQSRRQEILAAAKRLGFTPFQAQLLIAQVQFGDGELPSPVTGGMDAARPRARGAWAGVAATGVLAVAMFLFLVHWAGGL